MIYLIRIIFFIYLLANIVIAQQTGGPFQFNLKVKRKNLNRTDCFSDDIDFNKPKKFELTIYDNSIKQYLNTRKINIYEPPIGFLNNCDNHPELIPFIKHFYFQILPLEYNQKHKVLKIKINYAIDELTNIQSNKKQNIIRSYQTVQKNVPLGKPFNLSEISSVDSLHNVSIEIFNRVDSVHKTQGALIFNAQAWELLAKGLLIRNKEDIFLKGGSTITAEKAINKLRFDFNKISKEEAGVIQQIISLRHEAVHNILPKIPDEILTHLMYFSIKS